MGPYKSVSMAGMKRHPSLIPLFACITIGAGWAAYYIGRLATRNPDVCWDKKNNPHPNDKYATKQYKFYSPIRDYSKNIVPEDRPKLE